MSLIVAVIHYPVYNRNGEIVATSITSTEIQDVGRTCMTFNVKLCYIVTPLKKQRDIVERMKEHWTLGYGARYNPYRAKALSIVRTASDLQHLLMEVDSDNLKPAIIGTSARKREDKNITFSDLARMIKEGKRDILLLFGTGWGLTDEIVRICDRMLEPISGAGDYNHLSMRVAMGIILDRIFNLRGGTNE